MQLAAATRSLGTVNPTEAAMALAAPQAALSQQSRPTSPRVCACVYGRLLLPNAACVTDRSLKVPLQSCANWHAAPLPPSIAQRRAGVHKAPSTPCSASRCSSGTTDPHVRSHDMTRATRMHGGVLVAADAPQHARVQQGTARRRGQGAALWGSVRPPWIQPNVASSCAGVRNV